MDILRVKRLRHEDEVKNGWRSTSLYSVEGDSFTSFTLCSKNSAIAVMQTSVTLKLTLILRRSRTGTVWFYTSTSNKRAARPKEYTESLTRDLKLMYSRLTLVRISINL